MNRYDEHTFRAKIDAALRQVRTILDNTRNPQSPADVPHRYEDKYLLAEFVGSVAIASLLQCLELVGLSEEGLQRLREWAKTRTITLRLNARETSELRGRDQAEGHVFGDIAAVGGRRSSAALADGMHGLVHLRRRPMRHAERQVEVLEDRADFEAQGRGNGKTLAVELLEQAADLRCHVLRLAPGLAALHAGHVAERDAHMDRGIEIAQGDRQQASSIDEPVAEQRLAEGESLRAARCRHGSGG